MRTRGASALPRFQDRRDAGRRLAELLADELPEDGTVVLGIPRGGVVVASEVAKWLGVPLDVLVVRKLGYPGHEEAGFGAIGEDGVLVPESLSTLAPADRGYELVQRSIAAKRAEVEERVRLYRGGRPREPVAGRTAVVVDDGIATGYTFAAALAVARAQAPSLLAGAAPVASHEGAAVAAAACDRLVTVGTTGRSRFFAVSLHYEHFPQVSDDQVVALLRQSGPGRTGPEPPLE